jgi:Ribbon-helix-helix protein, copG family
MPKNVTRTVRLDDDLDAAIQEKAKEANTSVNFLVNRLIRKYIDWDIPGEKFGLGPVSASLVNRLFEDKDDKSAFDLGRVAAHEFYEPFAKYLFGELTFETSILLFRRASDYGGRYTFDSNSDRKHQVLVLRHNGGSKISKFYSGIFQGVYGDILKMEVRVESTEDYCVVQLPAVALA